MWEPLWAREKRRDKWSQSPIKDIGSSYTIHCTQEGRLRILRLTQNFPISLSSAKVEHRDATSWCWSQKERADNTTVQSTTMVRWRRRTDIHHYFPSNCTLLNCSQLEKYLLNFLCQKNEPPFVFINASSKTINIQNSKLFLSDLETRQNWVEHCPCCFCPLLPVKWRHVCSNWLSFAATSSDEELTDSVKTHISTRHLSYCVQETISDKQFCLAAVRRSRALATLPPNKSKQTKTKPDQSASFAFLTYRWRRLHVPWPQHVE